MMKRIKLLATFACIAAPIFSNAQSVVTYAGIQYADSGKFLGTAANPLLSEYYSRPQSLALDTNNRMYVTDEHNVMLCDGGTSRNRGGYRGDPTSTLSLGSANGTGMVSRFSTPEGVAVHPSSNDVYVCDRNNNLIRKGSRYVNSSNETSWSTFAGVDNFTGGYVDGPISTAQFNWPCDIEILNGIYYIVDFQNNCIRKIDNGTVSTIAGNGNAPQGLKNGKDTTSRFYFPSGLCIESSTTLLVADKDNNAIRRINLSTGQVTTVISSGLNLPTDVLSIGGNIFICEATCIKRWDGSNLTVFSGSPTTGGYKDAPLLDARFKFISHIIYRKADQCIYAVDNGNNVIRKIPFIINAVADFAANNTAPIVNQTVKLTSNCVNSTNYTWVITPANYTLQANSKLTDKDVYVSFNQVGSYSVKLTSSNVSTSSVKDKVNYINVSTDVTAAPLVDFTASNVIPSPNETVTLVDLTANNPTSYTWTITPNTFAFQNGTTNTSRNPEVKFTAVGKYSIKLDATNGNGSNSKTKTDYISVATNSSNKVVTERRFSVFPNPANESLHVIGANENTQVQLISMNGQITVLPVETSNAVSIQHVASGLYFVRIIDQGIVIPMGKYIIQH